MEGGEGEATVEEVVPVEVGEGVKEGEEEGLECVFVGGGGVGEEGGEEGGSGGGGESSGVVLSYSVVVVVVSVGGGGEEGGLLLFLVLLVPSLILHLLLQHQFYIRRAEPSFPPALPPFLVFEELAVQHAEKVGMTQVGQALDQAGREGGREGGSGG